MVNKFSRHLGSQIRFICCSWKHETTETGKMYPRMWFYCCLVVACEIEHKWIFYNTGQLVGDSPQTSCYLLVVQFIIKLVIIMIALPATFALKITVKSHQNPDSFETTMISQRRSFLLPYSHLALLSKCKCKCKCRDWEDKHTCPLYIAFCGHEFCGHRFELPWLWLFQGSYFRNNFLKPYTTFYTHSHIAKLN